MAPSPKESPSEESPPAPSGSNSSKDISSPSKNSPSPSQSQSSSPPPEKSSGRKKDSQGSQSYPPPPAKKKSGNTHSPPHSSNSHKTNGNKQVGSSGKTPSSNSSENDIDIEIIIIAAVFVGLVLLSMIICIIYCCRKRRKISKVMYYDESKAGGKDHNNHQNSPWVHSGKVPEHAVHVPPPSGGGGGMGGGRGMQPPFYNSEASSQFSGPHHPPPFPPLSPTMALGFNKSTFTYEELLAATNGFSQATLIGQGGFGFVYKGVLPNGKEVAIKTLKTGSGQGEREFQAEVEIISRVHHRYLVSLVGYCIAGGQRMLVYDFVPNKTLEYHLHGKDHPVMDFPTRLRIALGSAKGLAYLHEDCHPRIIHRDIKAANILLDNNFDAMVADFGLAKLSSDNYTHVSTRVMGTFGYLAPEYASSGKLTDRSDVFSFGVMLLELITGKQPIDVTMDDSLVDWARPLLARALEDGNFNELVDPRLEKNYNHNEMQRMIACAAASIRHSARKRPKMSQIARILEGDSSLDSLNEGTKPGQSTIFGASGEYNSSLYNADMQRFRQLALGSQEFASSEYGTSSGDNSREMGPGGMRKETST
ncbi:Proline-rich receptor-like protein kinase PERK5 [Hibiscus syriacus]|uniref:non-specific serine/threonine protein kinase n=1 Tax=Hibiscus syriacus TaxID=106335 RepID=A0A6A2ZVM2_HIBSY|nr:proline-rich receptor-like protein kinase PERK4 [Hibiscus syriacus]KAE8695172.1 Proline-rich receptor-like protein kinase PERK5 [Hibiscus syriacus]